MSENTGEPVGASQVERPDAELASGVEADPKLDPETDLRTRWLPSPEQMDNAMAALAQVPAARREDFIAVVPLAQPGKEYGFWQTGQPVVCLPGVWVGENTAGESDQPLGAARDAAEEASATWLREQGLSGTTAVAMIRPDGTAAVFEGFASLRTKD